MRFPLALLFKQPGQEQYATAWVENENSARPCLYTPIRNYFTLKEAEIDLGIDQWIIKVKVENDVFHLPLQYIRDLSFVACHEKQCPGEITTCQKKIDIYSGEMLLRLFDLDRFISKHPVPVRFRNHQKRKIEETQSHLYDDCRPRDVPISNWTQDFLDNYFNSEERNVIHDPQLLNILSIQYHSIGTSLYECQWMHPYGQNCVTYHRGGQLQINSSYMKKMIDFKKKNPDQSTSIDKFDE